MTGQNTRPTPSSDVEKAQQAADAIGVTPNSNMRPFVVQAVLYALSRLSPPAQVEVTDELRSAAEQVLNYATLDDVLDDKGRHENDVFAIRLGDLRRLRAALTATDAKPVVPAKPVAFQFWLEVQQCWTNMPTDWKPEEDTEGKYTIRPLYAASPSPVEGDLERLRGLIDVALEALDTYAEPVGYFDRYGDTYTSKSPTHPGIYAAEKAASIRANLASEGKTDA